MGKGVYVCLAEMREREGEEMGHGNCKCERSGNGIQVTLDDGIIPPEARPRARGLGAGGRRGRDLSHGRGRRQRVDLDSSLDRLEAPRWREGRCTQCLFVSYGP